MSRRFKASMKSRQSAARAVRWALWSTIAVVTACSSAVSESPSISEETKNDPGSGGAHPGGAGDGSSGVGAAADGLPCKIATLLAAKCTSCHSTPPVAYAPMALVSYADLVAPAKSDASKTNAVVTLARMSSAASPMPPSPAAHASAGEIATFAAWINAGTPMGSCGGVDAGPNPIDGGSNPVDAGPNPFDAPPQCTSSTFSTVKEGSSMKPGRAGSKGHRRSGRIAEGRKALERRDDLEAAAQAWVAAGSSADGLPRGAQLAYLRGAEGSGERAQRFLEAAVARERASVMCAIVRLDPAEETARMSMDVTVSPSDEIYHRAENLAPDRARFAGRSGRYARDVPRPAQFR